MTEELINTEIFVSTAPEVSSAMIVGSSLGFLGTIPFAMAVMEFTDVADVNGAELIINIVLLVGVWFTVWKDNPHVKK